MEENISDFVTIERKRNGQMKITCSHQNEENIYKKIRDMGFRKLRLDYKDVYIQRKGTDIVFSSIVEITRAFKEFLGMTAFTSTSIAINYSDLSNGFLKVNPIKRNSPFDHFLVDIFTEEENHLLRMKTDSSYKHKYKKQEMLENLKEWGFTATVDNIGEFTSSAPLYYKQIGENVFLIFTHSNAEKKKSRDEFHCFKAEYKRKTQIGKEKPINWTTVKLGFDIDIHYYLIENYIGSAEKLNSQICS